jgi:hypothetical protein
MTPRALLRDAGHTHFQLFDQTLALTFASERAGDFSDVLPDVGEGVGPKRYDLHSPSTPRAQRRLDVFEAYGADLAMVLGDDDIGPKRFELLRIDAVDGKPFLQDGLDAGVNVVARAAHREFRLRQGRQARYVAREVAFMGTADKKVAGTERTDDLRRARDQRNHASGLSIGHLAQMLPPGNDGNQQPDGRR